MNGITINEIRFINYRQYGTGTLKFHANGNHNLSVIIAQNGTGKTTFLNAITWCLYGYEFQLIDKNRALSVLNTEVLANAEIGKQYVVSVSLIVIDGEKTLEFKRNQEFTPIIAKNGTKEVIQGPSKFIVSVTSQNFTNTKVIDDVEAEFLRKQYFHDDIHDFYFFDGENLKEFFSPGREKEIRKSIFNISQVTLLENVLKHVNSLSKGYSKELAKDYPNIKEIRENLTSSENLYNSQNELLNNTKNDLSKDENELKNINEILQKYKPVKDLQSERKQLETGLKRLVNDKEQLHNDRNAFIRKYTFLVRLYPRIKSILSYINDKEDKGEMPPSIDIIQVKALLSILNDDLNQLCPCPLCNQNIGKTGKAHLESLLEKATVSSKTSNFLKEIKGPLQQAAIDVKDYYKYRKELVDREIQIEEDEKRISDRLKEINQILINYENTGEDKINVSKLEKRRIELTNKINASNRFLGAICVTIANIDSDIKRYKEELDNASSTIELANHVRKQYDVSRMMEKYYSVILANITKSMRLEIEDTTRDIFNKMNWKKNTFGKMTIDDNYLVSVYDANGNIMTSSLSATEQMALAYAFILAIHKASGRNCPLVIDSPIGRSSDKNRESIAESLLNISKEKQIILLFTPDDYTIPIQKLFAEKAHIRRLQLSDNEKFVEGIDC